MNFPKLIVFDFHGTLSLRSGTGLNTEKFIENFEIDDMTEVRINDLKKSLRKYKSSGWYSAMEKSRINPFIMMPTLNEVITFVDMVRDKYKGTMFAIASMLEDEQFMYDMMKYCFESQNKISPFVPNAIVSSHSLINIKSRDSNDKWPHIVVILKRMNLPFEKSKIVLIDDNNNVVEYMKQSGICSVQIEKYFTISELKDSCFSVII